MAERRNRQERRSAQATQRRHRRADSVEGRPRAAWRAWWAPVLIIIVLVVAYLPVLERATYIWDDARYVTENPTLRSADGLTRIWTELGATIQYYPMVFSTFWAEYQFWGLKPFGYHLVNLLLHAMSTVLLWQVLRRLGVPGAWLAAGIFALHPLQVESVAWIAERKNVLSGAFYLAALLAYLRFALPAALPASGEAATNGAGKAATHGAGKGAKHGAGKAAKHGAGKAAMHASAPAAPARPWRYYLLALILFALALLSKTVTCSLPAVILLLCWWRKDRLSRSDLIPLLPMFVIGAGMGMVTTWMEKHSVHAEGADWDFSLLERGLIAGRALWFYAGKLLWPHPIIFNYPRWQIDVGNWWQYLFPLAFLLVVAVLWLVRQRLGKAPLVAVLIFGGTLVPALGFVDVYPMRYAFVADHFQYLAGAALAALVAALLTRILAGGWRRVTVGERAGSGAGSGTGGWQQVVPILLLLVLAALTWRQGHAYEDRATLWRDTLRKNPDSFLAHCNLGSVLLDQGLAAQALPHLEDAVRLKPDMHEAHASLGQALVDLGRVEEGKAHYLEAIRIKPTMAWAYQSLGTALAAEGELDEAVEHYRRAIELEPEFTAALYNLANVLARQEKRTEAIALYYRALELTPDDAALHNNLGNALAQNGQHAQAVPHYREAVRLRPGYGLAQRNLGLALATIGDLEGALEAFWLALRADADDAVSHFGLAQVLERRGQLDGAVKEYGRALALDPEHAAARQALAALEARRQDAGGQRSP